MSGPHEVVLYGRPGCHLCDDARAIIRRVAAAHPFVLQERNIEESDELLRAYLERIPVVCVDGVEAFELFVDEQRLAAAVSAERETPARNRPTGH